MIRAYIVKRQMAFIDQHFDEATKSRIESLIPADLRQEIVDLKPADWCSGEYSSVVLRAISAASSDPKSAYADLVQCGKSISAEATNTFYKMLLKVLTPGLFFKKIQMFWSRDFKDVGVWEKQLDESGTSATLTLRGVKSLDHIGPITEGFVCFVLESMGLENLRCEMKGWSLTDSAPDEIQYDLSWG